MRLHLSMIALLAFALPGCDQSAAQSPSGKKLSLSQPSSQTLKRGETNEISISISRENFSAPLKVKFLNLPKGVKVVDERDIPGDQTRVVYTLHADNDADLVTNHEAQVTVEGPDQLATTQTFKLTIEAK